MEFFNKLLKDPTIYNLLKQFGLIKFPKKEKFYLLNFIKAISKSGQDEKKAINSKLGEYKERNKFILHHILMKVKTEIDKGKKFSDALNNAGILSEKEYEILRMSKGGLAQAIDKIIEANQKSSKSIAAFTLLLVPPSIMLVALLATHDLVKGVLYDMLSPIRDAGGTPPPIKPYLLDNTQYIVYNVMFFGTIISTFAFFYLVKKYHPKRYLTIFPIIEEEYVLDILKSLYAVSNGGGINISNSARALAIGEPNSIKKQIFDTIVERTSNGKEKISEVFKEYGVNYTTISSLRIGEEANNINIGLETAIDELTMRYEKDISLFLKASMWIGQLGMLGAAGKPMIDIMLLMSVGQLNFKV